jgi:hypothetical protein
VAGTCGYGEEISGSINAGNFLTSCRPVSFSRRTLLRGVSKQASTTLNCMYPNNIFTVFAVYLLIPAVARSKAEVCGLSLAGIAGSKPAGSTVVCFLRTLWAIT